MRTYPKIPVRRQFNDLSPGSTGTPVGDRSLVAELIARRPSTLMQIYDDHAGAVYAMTLRMVGNVDAAEHMVENAFLALWRSPERVLSEGQGIRSYLLCEAILGDRLAAAGQDDMQLHKPCRSKSGARILGAPRPPRNRHPREDAGQAQV